MFSRRRGKKALERLRANAAACVLGKASAVLREALGAEDLGAVGPFERARAWRRGSRPARLAHRAPAAAGRTLPSGRLHDQRGHPEDEGDDDGSGHESRCDEGDHRVGGALEAEHPAARCVAAVDARAERRELHRRRCRRCRRARRSPTDGAVRFHGGRGEGFGGHFRCCGRSGKAIGTIWSICLSDGTGPAVGHVRYSKIRTAAYAQKNAPRRAFSKTPRRETGRVPRSGSTRAVGR